MWNRAYVNAKINEELKYEVHVYIKKNESNFVRVFVNENEKTNESIKSTLALTAQVKHM